MRRIAMLVLVVIGLACNDSVPTGECANLAIEGASNWRTVVLDQTSHLPGDTSVMAAVMFHGSPSESDSLHLTAHGGTVVYAFRGLPAYNVSFIVNGIRALAVDSSNGNIEFVQLGIRGTRFGCES